MYSEDGPRVFTRFSLGWGVKIWRKDPGFSSIYLLGLKYEGRGTDPGFSSIYLLGVKLGGRGKTDPIFHSALCTHAGVKHKGKELDPGFSSILKFTILYL
jgi:hypothetical protein